MPKQKLWLQNKKCIEKQIEKCSVAVDRKHLELEHELEIGKNKTVQIKLQKTSEMKSMSYKADI